MTINKETLSKIVITIITFLLLGLYVIVFAGSSNSKFSNYEERTLLKYNHTKCELVDATQRYIDSIAPNNCLDGLILVDKCLEYNMDICFVLAQGQKESHFGTQGIARKTNSVWNVLAYDGQDVTQIHSKGKYKNPNESIEPYLKLLKNDYLYNKTEYDLLDKYVNRYGNRYASDPYYEDSLRNIYTSIKEGTSIDVLVQKLKKYQVILGK